jgi:hypothetical protein
MGRLEWNNVSSESRAANLWLAFILSMYHLNALAQGLAGWMGLEGIEVFRPVAIVHVLVIGAALWALGAWSSDEEPAAASAI